MVYVRCDTTGNVYVTVDRKHHHLTLWLPMKNSLIRRIIAYLWAGPCSLLGLGGVLSALVTGGQVTLVSGVLEVALSSDNKPFPRYVRLLPFHAITLGHVVIGASPLQLEKWRSHERIHVAQYEVWGPLFLFAYPIASLIQKVQGNDPYLHNPFEVQAHAAEDSENKKA